MKSFWGSWFGWLTEDGGNPLVPNEAGGSPTAPTMPLVCEQKTVSGYPAVEVSMQKSEGVWPGCYEPHVRVEGKFPSAPDEAKVGIDLATGKDETAISPNFDVTLQRHREIASAIGHLHSLVRQLHEGSMADAVLNQKKILERLNDLGEAWRVTDSWMRNSMQQQHSALRTLSAQLEIYERRLRSIRAKLGAKSQPKAKATRNTHRVRRRCSRVTRLAT